MSENEKDSPGVIVPPPLMFLGGLLAGGIVNRFYPVFIFPVKYMFPAMIAGGLLVFAGLCVILNARLKMGRRQTNIEPWKPTTAIISDGIYARSRNPVYLAMAVIYLGIALIFNSLWFLPFLILVLYVLHYGVIRREEIYLENKFGQTYLDYKKEVRRWI